MYLTEWNPTGVIFLPIPKPFSMFCYSPHADWHSITGSRSCQISLHVTGAVKMDPESENVINAK